MKNKDIKARSKGQRIKKLVKAFENCNVTFQDVIDEYNRLRKQKYVKTTSK